MTLTTDVFRTLHFLRKLLAGLGDMGVVTTYTGQRFARAEGIGLAFHGMRVSGADPSHHVPARFLFFMASFAMPLHELRQNEGAVRPVRIVANQALPLSRARMDGLLRQRIPVVA